MSSEENYFIFPEKAYKYTDDFICEEFICLTGLYFWTEGCAYCDETPENKDCGCCGPRGRDCITCYMCFSPLGIAFDMATLPFRFLYCIGDGSVQTCKKVKNCCCKVVDKQPTAEQNNN